MRPYAVWFVGTTLPVSTSPATTGEAPWWSSPVGMVTIGLVGLVVVAVGGLALAVIMAFVVGRGRLGWRGASGRQEGDVDTAQNRPDSTGTALK